MLKAPFLFDVILVAVHTIECSLDEVWLLSVLVIRWTVFDIDVNSIHVAWPLSLQSTLWLVFRIDVHSCHVAWPLFILLTQWLICHADAHSYPVAWPLSLVMIHCSLDYAFDISIAASVRWSEQHV